jgi:Kelch motif/Galactose oxidase, central domain
MTTPRAEQTAILFTSGPLAGKVLIAGGCCDSNHRPLNTAELYDPATQTFTAPGTMPVAAMAQTATLLPNGTVLLAGGTNAPGSRDSLSTAEIYNPQTQTFQLAGSLNRARQGGRPLCSIMDRY